MKAAHRPLLSIYQSLFDQHGPQHWWPGDTPFEIMVGAILTQNTAWVNVERAIANLRRAGSLTPAAIAAARPAQLAKWLRPSGYFNVKTKRLQAFCAWLLAEGGERALRRRPTARLRESLLAVHGIGPETADDMLLYAFDRPVFVIDAYTRRIFSRLGKIGGDEDYETLRAYFEKRLPRSVPVFNEYHALIVAHAKHHCRVRANCTGCSLARRCPARVLAT